MPSVFIAKRLYDKIVEMRYDVGKFVNEAVEKELKRVEEEKKKEETIR